MNQTSARKKRGCGCFGCLGSLIGFLVFGTILLLLITAVFQPWAFYLGGRFHIVPMWQGLGKFHTPNQGDYTLFVRTWPATHGGSRRGYASLQGVAYLCTPRHERIRLILGGSMERHLGSDTQGKPVYFYFYYRALLFGSFSTERRPGFDLYGTWGPDQLPVDDHSSISRAFTPDGRVYRSGGQDKQASFGPLQTTLRPGTMSDFDSACPAEP
jgi:hypothetical protein